MVGDKPDSLDGGADKMLVVIIVIVIIVIVNISTTNIFIVQIIINMSW